MAIPENQEPFRRALAEFTKGLSPQEKDEFRLTSIDDLRIALSRIQKKHESQRELRGLNRLSGFLEAMEQYGKVIEVFGNSSEFVGFVWVRPPSNITINRFNDPVTSYPSF